MKRNGSPFYMGRTCNEMNEVVLSNEEATVTKARATSKKRDKPKAHLESLSEQGGKIAYAKCLEKTQLKHVLFWFGAIYCLHLLRNTYYLKKLI